MVPLRLRHLQDCWTDVEMPVNKLVNSMFGPAYGCQVWVIPWQTRVGQDQSVQSASFHINICVTWACYGIQRYILLKKSDLTIKQWLQIAVLQKISKPIECSQAWDKTCMHQICWKFQMRFRAQMSNINLLGNVICSCRSSFNTIPTRAWQAVASIHRWRKTTISYLNPPCL